MCVDSNHYAGDVKRDLVASFSGRQGPDGRPGMFHPENFTFGDNVLLSQMIARCMKVQGVSWAGLFDKENRLVGHFRRLDEPGIDYHREGEIPVADDEVARLDSDPNYPDNGRLRLIMAGGR